MSEKKMDSRVIGILTGISYQSGLDYYKGINELYASIKGKRLLMPPNPKMVMVSVDCDEYAHMLTNKDWDGVKRYLLEGVQRLKAAGSEFIVIASNTGHICLDNLMAPAPLPYLHIADCTAKAIKDKGLSKVGLLGTEPTMRENYLIDRLKMHGLEVIVPELPQDLTQIFQYIMHELGFGVFKPETLEFFKSQVMKLVQRGAQGVILGCTEIELLIKQEHCPSVPLFASGQLHISAAAQVTAGTLDISAFNPN